jgi:hypothetical protein
MPSGAAGFMRFATARLKSIGKEREAEMKKITRRSILAAAPCALAFAAFPTLEPSYDNASREVET